MISDMSMSARQSMGVYLREAKYEFVRIFRSPSTIPALLVPCLFYLFFGVYLGNVSGPASATRVLATYVHWTAFGVMGPGMFGFGVSVALERDQGLLALKRALPMPPAAYLLAKMVISTAFAAVITITITVASILFAHPSLSVAQFVAVGIIATLGALPFSAIGLFIGTRVPGQSAAGIVYLVYIPAMLLAGLFFPVPKAIEYVSPAFYLDQLMARAADLKVSDSIFIHISVLSVLTLTLTFLSVRKLARVG